MKTLFIYNIFEQKFGLIMVECGRIILILRSNYFGQICHIRSKSTFETGIKNSKNRNSNEFQQIRPSLGDFNTCKTYILSEVKYEGVTQWVKMKN